MVWIVERKEKVRNGDVRQRRDEGKEGTSRGTIKAKANSIAPIPCDSLRSKAQ